MKTINSLNHHTLFNTVSKPTVLAIVIFFTYSSNTLAQTNDFDTVKENAETAIQSLKTKFEKLKTAAKTVQLTAPAPVVSPTTAEATPVNHSTAAPPDSTASTDIQQGVGKMSVLRGLVNAEQIETQANQQYQQILQEAATQRTLGAATDAQVVRLRSIAQKIIPFTSRWNDRANQWKWEINLINAKQINAFCMPGGKIVFYSGILDQLKLSDDEVAIIMGHEIAHALREHGRERIGKSAATQGVLAIGSSLLGLGDTGRALAGAGANLLTLKFGREDETEGDLVGMDLAARAGYDPRAGISLWQKMSASNKGAPPQWLSTHPSGKNRINEMSKHLPKVLPLYANTRNMAVAQLPVYQPNWPTLKPIK